MKTDLIPGTEDARGYFWFPDSQSIGISTRNQLKRFSLNGGPSQVIASVEGEFLGAAANDAGVVIFTDVAKGPLYKTPVNGGTPIPATSLDKARQEISHVWPQFLPDGRRFMYFAISQNPNNSGMFVGSFDSPEKHLVLTSRSRGGTPPGFLLFARDGVLLAQSFDPSSLQLGSEAKTVTGPLSTFTGSGSAFMTTSNTGLIGFLPDLYRIENSRLIWFDRSGKETGTVANPGSYWMLNLSPDNKRIAVNLQNASTRNFDIWIGDLERGTMSPFISDSDGNFDPEWSPDGRIAFTSDRGGPFRFRRMAECSHAGAAMGRR